MADIEHVLVAALLALFPQTKPCTETPPDPEYTEAVQEGIIRVQRIGGPRLYALDRPIVVIDCFRPTRVLAKQLAEDVFEALYLKLPGMAVGGGAVSHATVLSGPSWAPWDNTTVRRFVGTCQFHVKNS